MRGPSAPVTRPYAVAECVAFLRCMRVTRLLPRDLARYLCDVAMRTPMCSECRRPVESATRSWAEHVAQCDSNGYRLVRAHEAKRQKARAELDARVERELRATAVRPCVTLLHCIRTRHPPLAHDVARHVCVVFMRESATHMQRAAETAPLVVMDMLVQLMRNSLERREYNTTHRNL